MTSDQNGLNVYGVKFGQNDLIDMTLGQNGLKSMTVGQIVLLV